MNKKSLYEYKIQKYLTKYNQLISQIENNSGGVIGDFRGLTRSKYPALSFNKDTTEPEIKLWSDVYNRFINYDPDTNIINVSKAGIDTLAKLNNLYGIINSINIEGVNNDNLYFVCLQYISYPDRDFQIGITETIVRDETNLECANRGSVEEVGIFCLRNLNYLYQGEDISYFGLNANTSAEIIRPFTNTTPIKLKSIDNHNNYELNGGHKKKNPESAPKPPVDLEPVSLAPPSPAPPVGVAKTDSTESASIAVALSPAPVRVARTDPSSSASMASSVLAQVQTRKSQILIYGSLDSLTVLLQKRYAGDLTYANYLRINKKKLDDVNKEKKEIQIIAVAKSELIKIMATQRDLIERSQR